MIDLTEFFTNAQVAAALVLIAFFLMFIFFGKVDRELQKGSPQRSSRK